MKLGCLPYLNVRPLVHTMENGGLPTGYEFVYAPPSELAKMLSSGEISAAPVSAFATFIDPRLEICPGICIAADGPVKSVLVLSKVPPERIRTVALDTSSLSGANMAKIILSESYGLEPEFVRADPQLSRMLERADAALMIGDPAMQCPKDGLHVLDLAEEWKRLTGLPAVFAVWAGRGITPELIDLLHDAKRQGLSMLPRIAQEESVRLSLPYDLCYEYLSETMVYDMGEREQQGLRAFREKAAAHRLIDAARAGDVSEAQGMRTRKVACDAKARKIESQKGRLNGATVAKAVPLFGVSGFRDLASEKTHELETHLCKTGGGYRITQQDALALMGSASLPELAWMADAMCGSKHPEPIRTYVIDRNINYTNICTSGCRFCAFYRPPGDPEGYVLTTEQILAKVAEAVDLGATQILMQGGLHPDLEIAYYEDLLAAIKGSYRVQIHSLSAPEIAHIASGSGLSLRDTLTRLQVAGLDSLPGGGAEILVDSVRSRVSPRKCSVDTWLEVMRTASELGMRATATMVFGMGESLADRITHLDRIRALQDETGVFTAFIPWPFQPGNTDLGGSAAGAHDYLRTLALSRIYLDNIDNIQASWVTQGEAIAQLALRFGANDIGSTMIEENVVAATGVSHRLSEDALIGLIHGAGFDAAQRTTLYDLVRLHRRGER